MKNAILQALKSDVSGSIRQHLVSLFGKEDVRNFYSDFIQYFTLYDLEAFKITYKYKEDNLLGIIEDFCCMVIAGYLSADDYYADNDVTF